MSGAIKREVVIGDCRLLLGDCLEILPTLGRVDAVVTDPPYGVGLQVKQHKWFRQQGSGYSSTDDTKEFILRVCVPAIEMARGISKRVVFTPGTRNAFLYPQPDDIGGAFNRSGSGLSRWGFSCFHPVLYYGKDPYLSAGLGGRPNAWEQSPSDYAEKNDHPCPKPIGMMRWIVNRASLEGDTVLDPFMGSGTTGVACVKLGRKFIGVEVEPSYFDIACKRIEEAYRQPDMFLEARKAECQQSLLSGDDEEAA